MHCCGYLVPWVILQVLQWPRAAATLPPSARADGSCRRTCVTIALASCAAMRNLVPGRLVHQPATPKSLGPDLGSGPVKVMGSDLGTGAVKPRAGDSQ